MKIYLAGPCDSEHRTLMVKAATFLRGNILEVYCPWELKIDNAWDYTQEDWSQLVFDADVKAIDESDAVIMISVGRESTAGTNWEQGYAYAKGKPVYVIQITDKATSLMTFCGCTWFFNSSEENLADTLNIVYMMLDGLFEGHVTKYCKTTLT